MAKQLSNLFTPIPMPQPYQTNFERLIEPHANHAKVTIQSSEKNLFTIKVNSIRPGFQHYIQSLIDSRFIASNMAVANREICPFDVTSFRNEGIVSTEEVIAAIKADLTDLGYVLQEGSDELST